MNRLIGAGLVVCLFVVACGGSSRDEASDRAQLAAMEQEIVALVGEPVCGDSPDCRSIGFGAIYSVATVDNVVLTSKVAAYNEFNAELNIRYGWGSECSVALPPTLGCQAGVCVALNAR
jgi:hypothetical protein